MDKLLGEIVLCNCGEADRARTVRRPHSNAAFGGILTCCTLTPGGTPNLRAEDAVSSTVLSAACGELTTTDKSGEFSEGDDIFTAQVCFGSLPVHRCRSLSSQHWASVDNLQLVGPDVFADVFDVSSGRGCRQNFLRPHNKPTPTVTRISVLKTLDALVQNRPPAVLNPSKNGTPTISAFSHFVFFCFLLVPSFNSGRNLTYALFLDLPPQLRNHL